MEVEDILRIRENFYGFLHRMYLEEPPVELAEDIVNGTFPPQYEGALNEDMMEGFRILSEFAESSKDVSDTHEQLVDEYTRLFIGPGKLPVSPYESKWVG